MALWFVFGLMAVAALFAVLWPLTRPAAKLRSGSDLAVYRDQLAEIERDRVAGIIAANESEAAQIEVSRRLLAAADSQAKAVVAPLPATASRHRRLVAAIALVVIPLGVATLYLALGSPFLPGQPLATRSAGLQGQSIEGLIAQVETHLAQNPDDGRGWEVIAPIYLRMGRPEAAVNARRNTLRISGETAERRAELGEALVALGNGVVTAEAKQAFERAVALDPAEPKARYFLGLAAVQDGRQNDAAAIWRSMLADAPADAPWAGFVREELARLSGPANAPVLDDKVLAEASELGADQRNVMIRTMVARLAERLQQDGADLQGWLRLVRSYMVLGERDKAIAAAADARRALAQDQDKLRQLDALVKELGLEG
jgi:cytochrome c-type biogenesis protein CcmH